MEDNYTEHDEVDTVGALEEGNIVGARKVRDAVEVL